jgi:hypothetical protein
VGVDVQFAHASAMRNGLDQFTHRPAMAAFLECRYDRHQPDDASLFAALIEAHNANDHTIERQQKRLMAPHPIVWMILIIDDLMRMAPGRKQRRPTYVVHCPPLRFGHDRAQFIGHFTLQMKRAAHGGP